MVKKKTETTTPKTEEPAEYFDALVFQSKEDESDRLMFDLFSSKTGEASNVRLRVTEDAWVNTVNAVDAYAARWYDREVFNQYIRSEFAKPFPLHAVQWKPQSKKFKGRGKHAGKAVVYAVPFIDGRYVQGRLDRVLGPTGWSLEYKEVGGAIFAGIGVRCPDGEWVWKWDTGHVTQTEDDKERQDFGAKGTATDCLKRAAVEWGIGRYFYAMDAIILEYDVDRGRICETVTPQHVPKWFVPANEENADGTPKVQPCGQNGQPKPEREPDPESEAKPEPEPEKADPEKKGDPTAFDCSRCGNVVVPWTSYDGEVKLSVSELVDLANAQGIDILCGKCREEAAQHANGPKPLTSSQFWTWVYTEYTDEKKCKREDAKDYAEAALENSHDDFERAKDELEESLGS